MSVGDKRAKKRHLPLFSCLISSDVTEKGGRWEIDLCFSCMKTDISRQSRRSLLQPRRRVTPTAVALETKPAGLEIIMRMNYKSSSMFSRDMRLIENDQPHDCFKHKDRLLGNKAPFTFVIISYSTKPYSYEV